MIHWLVQSSITQPDLHAGIAPLDLLSQVEQRHLATLQIKKRRKDWLLGRWTVKHLLQSYIEQQTDVRLPLCAIVIDNDADGAPFVQLNPALLTELVGRPYDDHYANPTLSISISHSHDLAFCALYAAHDELGGADCCNPSVQIGADIEHIEPRADHFIEDYFTAEEIQQVRRAPAGIRDLLVTLIWSAKEAVLKALRVGLTVDTRQVSCLIGAAERVNSTWNSFVISCDTQLLAERVGQPIGRAVYGESSCLAQTAAFTGWWRTKDDYVLTIAILRKV
jgi:4'-phosphopantetheinyl transferase